MHDKQRPVIDRLYDDDGNKILVTFILLCPFQRSDCENAAGNK